MDTETTSKIISLSAQGLSTKEIGKHVGVDHTTVWRHQRKLRSQITEELQRLLDDGLRVARKGIVRASSEVIQQYKAKDRKEEYDKDLINAGMQANKLIMNAAGLIGNPSTVINQIIQVNQTAAIPPAVLEVLRAIGDRDRGQASMLDEVIDV